MVRPKKENVHSTSFQLETIKEFVNATRASVLLVTPGYEISFMNSAAESTWGKSVGKPCYEVLQGKKEPCPDCPMEEVFEKKSLFKTQQRMLTNNGWAEREVLYMFIKGPVTGKPSVALVSSDLMERSALEKEARWSRELSNALLKSINSLVIGFDRSGAISFVNRAAEKISGYSEAEIKSGDGINFLVPQEYRVIADEYFASPPEQPRAAEAVLIPIVARSGSRRMISWTYSPLAVGEGQAEGAIALGQDVTERFAKRREAEKLAEELLVVNTVLAKAGSSSDIDEMLKVALEALLTMPGYRCGAAYHLMQGGREGYRVALVGFRKAEPARVIGEAEGLFPTTTVIGKNIQIIGSRESGIHPDIKIALEAEGLQSVVGVPVFAEGQPVGIVLLGHEHEPEKAAAGLEVLKGAADALELSVENMRLRGRAEERAKEATALLRVAQSLTGTLDMKAALVKVAAEAAGLLEVDLCNIWIFDEGRNVLQMAAGDNWSSRDEKIDYVPFSTGGAMFEARRTLKPVIVDDTERDPRIPDYVVKERGVKSTLIVPLVMRGAFLGVLSLDMVSRRRRFTMREAELMESFGRQASIAIRNAYLVDELRESEERYRALADSSLFGLMMHDGREILYANDRVFEMSGYDRSEVRTVQDVLRLIMPEDREQVAEMVEEFLGSGGGPPYYDIKVRCKDGSAIMLHTLSNIITLGGRPVIMVTMMDVTQTYKTEEALKASEERYRTLVESSRDSILITDSSGNVIFANAACVRLVGVSSEEILGRNIYTVVHPSERRQVVERFFRGWETGKGVAHYPIRVVVGGEERFFEATTAVMGEPGPTANTMVIVSDVTERERAQRMLAESEGRYRTIVESSRDLIIMGNRAGEILYVNPASQSLFGYGPEELQGKYLFEFVHPDDRERAAKDFVNDWRTGRTIPNYPLRIMDAEERVHYVETTSGLVGWPSEDAVQIYLIRDVTERKQREAERELQARAEEVVAPIATRFVDPKDIYEAIAETLETVGELLDMKRTFYVEVPRSGSPAATVIQWVQGDRGDMAERLRAVEPEEFAWWLEAFGSRSEISFESAEDVPQSARNRIIGGKDPTGIAAAPVMVRNQVVGTIGFNSEEVPHSWSTHELNLLRDICDTVSRALERRQWVEQLGRSEKFRTRITEGIGEGLLVLTNGVITWLNNQVSEILGFHQEELVGRDMKFLLPESSLPGELVVGMVEPLQREGVLVVEEKARRKDGPPVYLVLNVTSLGVTEDGTAETLVAIRDVTEHRKAEAETRRRTRQLASLNEIVQAATSSLDLDTVAETIIKVAADVTGADAGMILLEGQPGTRRFAPMAMVGDVDGVQALNTVEARGEVVAESIDSLKESVILEAGDSEPGSLAAEVEDVIRDAGLAQVLAMPLRSGDKRVGFVSLGSRKEGVFDVGDKGFYDAAGAEIGVSIENALIYRELAAEHERLSLLYRSAQGISGELEPHSLLSRTAAEAARAVGARQAMVALVQPGSNQLKWSASYNMNLDRLKDTTLSLQSGIGGVVVETKRALLAPPEEELTPEMESILKNDPVAEVLGVLYGAAVPLISGDKVLGVLVLHMDKDDSKLSSEDMLLLEALGRQAGVAIENADLYDETRRHLEALEEAHRELMALDRMKSDFVSTVSHELRSPLAVIEGFAKTIVEHFDEIDPDTERESIEIILKKAISLEGLIENILDMSRIEEGRFEVSRETFELSALCEGVRSDLETMEDTLELKLEAEQPSIFVVADPEKTEVALGNLVRNALKFSPEGGTVLITARQRGSMVELSVTDSGIGIPQEELDRIFNRFYQVDSGETRSFGGSGLGLYITKELVQAMGGRVTVDSEPGRGSVFTFTLPLAT
jgi:PAS domain S-box-containing protein